MGIPGGGGNVPEVQINGPLLPLFEEQGGKRIALLEDRIIDVTEAVFFEDVLAGGIDQFRLPGKRRIDDQCRQPRIGEDQGKELYELHVPQIETRPRSQGVPLAENLLLVVVAMINRPGASRGKDHRGCVDVDILSLVVETPDAADSSIVTGNLGDIEAGEDVDTVEAFYQLRQLAHENNPGDDRGIGGNDAALRPPDLQEHACGTQELNG